MPHSNGWTGSQRRGSPCSGTSRRTRTSSPAYSQTCYGRTAVTAGFLLRIVDAEERQTVASEVEQDIAAVVKVMDETLIECAKGTA